MVSSVGLNFLLVVSGIWVWHIEWRLWCGAITYLLRVKLREGAMNHCYVGSGNYFYGKQDETFHSFRNQQSNCGLFYTPLSHAPHHCKRWGLLSKRCLLIDFSMGSISSSAPTMCLISLLCSICYNMCCRNSCLLKVPIDLVSKSARFVSMASLATNPIRIAVASLMQWKLTALGFFFTVNSGCWAGYHSIYWLGHWPWCPSFWLCTSGFPACLSQLSWPHFRSQRLSSQRYIVAWRASQLGHCWHIWRYQCGIAWWGGCRHGWQPQTWTSWQILPCALACVEASPHWHNHTVEVMPVRLHKQRNLSFFYQPAFPLIGNDHTNMTAPLPVCSAKLSMFGPG